MTNFVAIQNSMNLTNNWLKTVNLIVIIFYIPLLNQKDYYDIESKITRVVKMEKYCTIHVANSQPETILSCEGGLSGHLNR